MSKVKFSPRLNLEVGKIHPGWVFLLAILPIFIQTNVSTSFNHHVYQYIAATGACLLVELLSRYFLFGKNQLFKFSYLSSFITGTGLYHIIVSPHIWPYFAAGIISILAKYTITLKSKHIFNPSAFGALILFVYYPDYATFAGPYWDGWILSIVILGLCGFGLSYKVNRLPLSFSFVVTFILGAVIRGLTLEIPIKVLISPLTGVAMYLFTFFMITDPRTSPDKHKDQIIFGVAIGTIDMFLKFAECYYSLVLSLIITTLIRTVIENKEDLKLVFHRRLDA